MKAIVQDRYGDVDVLELRDIAKPGAGDEEVLIEVRAAGLDPGVWHLMTGRPYLVRVISWEEPGNFQQSSEQVLLRSFILRGHAPGARRQLRDSTRSVRLTRHADRCMLMAALPWPDPARSSLTL